MADVTPDIVARTLARDRGAAQSFLRAMQPVVHARVARAIVRRGAGRRSGRPVAQEVEDLVQDVFAALFADDARALRAWDPTRGMSITNFVGLIAEHEVANVFRNGRRRPWTEGLFVDEDVDLLPDAGGAETQIVSRQLLSTMLERMRADLTPRGLQLFQALFVEERPVADVCTAMDMTTDAVYAWRSRLARQMRAVATELADSERRPAIVPRRGATP